MSDHGAVLFDEPDKCGNGPGWASVAAGESRRIQGVHDLPQDCRWWSNLDYDHIKSTTSFRRTTVKHSRYLRTSMSHIEQEMGISQYDNQEKVSFLSFLFHNALNGAVEKYRINPSQVGVEDSLAHDMAKAYQLNQRPETRHPALEVCYQNITYCGGQWQQENRMTWARIPRLQHAINVLACPTPKIGSTWLPMDYKALSDLGDQANDYLMQFPQPLLIEATVTELASEMADIIGLGNTSASSKIDRTWFSHPEILWLSHYAKIKVKSVLYASQYDSPVEPDDPALAQLLPKPDLDLGFNQASITAGILAENYWVSLANKAYIRDPKANRNFSVATATGAWLRSVDRLYCFMAAARLRSLVPVNILNASVGSLSMSISEFDFAETKEAAESIGLIMPQQLGVPIDYSPP